MSLFLPVFLLFLLTAVCIYYACPMDKRWMVLLGASYVFYMWGGNWQAVFYVLLTTLTVWYGGKLMDKMEADSKAVIKAQKGIWSKEERKTYKEQVQKKRKQVFLCVLVLNLVVLGVTKYLNFVIENLMAAWNGLTGSGGEFVPLNLLVPLGISFYTFQATGYLIDIYYKKYPAEQNPAKFALFVSFFPQVIQGPIGRFDHLSKQLFEGNAFCYTNLSHGAVRILWGYFQKMVIADRVAPLVNTVFGHPDEYGGAIIVLGILGYALQLYADFAGGIDIVSGGAELFGVKLAPNFKRPYFSSNLGEFWRRWHISLGAWMRDYVFYPFAISKTMLNLTKKVKERSPQLARVLPAALGNLLVFFLVGIWHGAQWNFVLWGMYNGVILAISALLEPKFARFHERFPKLEGNKLWYVFTVLRTFVIVCIGYYFDRCFDVGQAFDMMATTLTNPMLGQLNADTLLSLGIDGRNYVLLALSMIPFVTVSVLQERGMAIREKLDTLPLPIRWGLLYALLFWVLGFAVTNDPFAGFMYEVF